MPRAPLPLEAWGKIRRTTTSAGTPAAVAYYRDLDGKRRRLLRTGPTGKKAEIALEQALRERLTPTDAYLTPTSTMTDLAEEWVRDLKKSKKSPSTIRRYESVVETRVKNGMGDIRIAEATVPRLQRVINLTEAESIAQARILGFILSGMMGLAVRQGVAKTNTAKSLRLPMQEQKDVRVPTVNELRELRALLSAYDQGKQQRGDSIRDLGQIADMMLATGARIGEVLALQWDDFNIGAWTITIQSTLVSEPGKGLVRRPPKTRSSVRTLTLPEFIHPMLSARYETAKIAWIFPSATGQPRWPENIRNQWNVATKGSSVEWIGPHDLRKAVATALGTEAARDQLGHATISVTDKHYIEKVTARPDQSQTLEQFGKLAG